MREYIANELTKANTAWQAACELKHGWHQLLVNDTPCDGYDWQVMETRLIILEAKMQARVEALREVLHEQKMFELREKPKQEPKREPVTGDEVFELWF